jgi:type I restriction enzyme M protein
MIEKREKKPGVKKNPEGRWRKYSLKQLLERDKANFDIFWLKDNNTVQLTNIPEPDVIIDDIIENMENALESLRSIKDSLD